MNDVAIKPEQSKRPKYFTNDAERRKKYQLSSHEWSQTGSANSTSPANNDAAELDVKLPGRNASELAKYGFYFRA